MPDPTWSTPWHSIDMPAFDIASISLPGQMARRSDRPDVDEKRRTIAKALQDRKCVAKLIAVSVVERQQRPRAAGDSCVAISRASSAMPIVCKPIR